MTTPRTILPILFVAMLYLLPPSLSAQNAGAVIFVDIQGEVKVQNLKSKAFLDAGEVAVGKSIIEGHAVESSGDGKVILLFSNGSMTTVTGKSKLQINEFKQAPFKGDANATIGALQKEPSSSQTKLKLDYGDLVFNVKTLDADSAFVMDSPVGSAAIRGTTGQLAITINADGTASGGVNMVEGAVSFTDPSGNTAPVPAGQATVVQVSPDGQQVGATQTVPVPAAVAQALTQVATEGGNAAQNITVENISNAAQEASTKAQEANQDAPPEGEAPQNGNQNEDTKAIDSIREQAAGAAGGAIFAAAGIGVETETLIALASNLTNTLSMENANHAQAIDLPVEVIVGATIQGSVEGAVAAATLAGMDPTAIQQIRAAAANITQPVSNLLGNLSLSDILANVDPSFLIAEVTEVGLTDADLAALNQGVQPQTLDVFIADRDGDGLADATEESIGTDPDNPDSDGDLLNDGVEHHIFASDPSAPDSDGDGVSDSVEVGLGTDPTVAGVFAADRDRDAIPDDWELLLGTDPDKNDSDGDGWHDGFELGVGSDPRVKDVQIADTGFTVSPLSPGDPHAWLFLGNFPE